MFLEAQDVVYQRVLEKFLNGTFTMGNIIKESNYSVSYVNLSEFSENSLSLQKRDYCIFNFTNSKVVAFIKNHINLFPRQFFKDLIVSNPNSLQFACNCFEIMPLEYIDEEMCSIAILNAINWSLDNWFFSVQKRKPEVLTHDLWKLGARFYSRIAMDTNLFFNITPDAYKDREYYFEMCNYNFYNNAKITNIKGKILQTVPEDIINSRFILQLLNYDIDNLAVFPEEILEKKLIYFNGYETITEKVWQYAIRYAGKSITYMSLNEERIKYFLKIYKKDSLEYNKYFKEDYKEFLKQQRDFSSVLKIRKNIKENFLDVRNSFFSEKDMKIAFLPKKYDGSIPHFLKEKFSASEYVKFLYQLLEIQILDESNMLFFKVYLPNSWNICRDGYWYFVKDENDQIIIHYLYYKKEYVEDAYIKSINIPIETLNFDDSSLNRKCTF